MVQFNLNEDDFLSFFYEDNFYFYKLGDKISEIIINNVLFRNFRFEFNIGSKFLRIFSSNDYILLADIHIDYIFSINQYKSF